MYLAEVGFALQGEHLCPLEGERTWHLIFPPGYFPAADQPWREKFHPTWNEFSERTAPMPFGGSAGTNCAFCGELLHHLLTLDPVPEGIGVSGLSRLTLVTCLSCLGWEVHTLFYAHDLDGRPQSLGSPAARVIPQFVVGPLRPAEVQLGQAARRWHWQAWGASNGRENLNRVGGPPAWVQSASHPDCVRCGRAMSSLMQLDSELPMAYDPRSWIWGSGGVGYGFWCDGCRISAWLWQCT
jgi:hypothetical protein